MFIWQKFSNIKESNRAILDERRSPPPPSPAPPWGHATWQPLHPGRLLLLLLLLLLMLLGHLALAFSLGALDYAYFIGCKIRKTFAGQPYSGQGELANKDFFAPTWEKMWLGKTCKTEDWIISPMSQRSFQKNSRVWPLPPPHTFRALSVCAVRHEDNHFLRPVAGAP